MLKILLGVFLVLSVSCSNSGGGGDKKIEVGNNCYSNFDCPDSTLTCDTTTNTCQPETATNCKNPAACTVDGQVCIQGTCQVGVTCTSNAECTATTEVCIAGACQAELPTNCKTDAVCDNTGTCDTTTAMCICGKAAACGAGHSCISNSCVAAAATRKVFFTAAVTPGTGFTGLAGANTLCQAIMPNSAAVLADSTTSAWDNIQSVGSGIPDDDVLPIVIGTSQVSGPARKPAQTGDFTNSNTKLQNLGSNTFWTGQQWSFFQRVNQTQNCSNWSINSGRGNISSNNQTGSTWASINWNPCSNAKLILCIQVNP